MAIERTLSIIKPDAVAKNVIGQIYARFEAAGLKIVAAKMAHLSRGEAEAFYAVHKERPFFKDLVEFMISGPVMIQVLEGEDAIAKNRELMGATDPKKADKGTIRADFADSIDANAVHGSDAAETAAVEIALLLPGMNVYTPLRRRGRTALRCTVNLLEFDRDGLAAFCEQLGEKRFRATQLFRWIHQRGARDFDAMTDLAKSLRDKLARQRRGRGAAGRQRAGVGRRHDQVAVRRRRRRRGRDRLHPRGRPRHAVHLVAGRLRGRLPLLLDRPPGLQPQPDAPARSSPSSGTPSITCAGASASPTGERAITNVVMMGMGEPLQNYAALVPALRVMLDDHGYGLSRRRVTVSTSGVVPMIDRLRDDCPVALAVSLHAPERRAARRAGAAEPQVPDRRAAGRLQRATSTRAPRDFITFEYCMLDGVNDAPEQARAAGDAGAAHAARRAVQVQPDSVQPVPRVGPEALAARARRGVRRGAAGRRHRHHGAQDARRRHRRRLRPAGRRGAGPHARRASASRRARRSR